MICIPVSMIANWSDNWAREKALISRRLCKLHQVENDVIHQTEMIIQESEELEYFDQFS